MPRQLTPGEEIQGYIIVEHITQGSSAHIYRATGPDRRSIFLKQYTEPTPKGTDWYAGYVLHMDEMYRRILAGRARHYCVSRVAAFEARVGGLAYYQAFEFVERGMSLEAQILEDEAASASGKRVDEWWRRRLAWARVLTAGIAALHEAEIVHCDLKLENVYLRADPHSKTGYQLKLIDMDRSLLVGRIAPWITGPSDTYTGTMPWYSPEHVQGRTPVLASDVFTLGLILYRTLTGRNPYFTSIGKAYADMVRGHIAPTPKFLGPFPDDGHRRELGSFLRRALAPDPKLRPSAQDIHALLLESAGKAERPTPVPPRTGWSGSPPPRLVLEDGRGQCLDFGLTMPLGRRLLESFGPDSRFTDAHQCTIERRSDGWFLVPRSGTTNPTLLNGVQIAEPTQLREGNIVAVGRPSAPKLQLTVRFRAK